ncbi:MAG: hypothetical protein WC000_09775, partial [Dokdonella sp.]
MKASAHARILCALTGEHENDTGIADTVVGLGNLQLAELGNGIGRGVGNHRDALRESLAALAQGERHIGQILIRACLQMPDETSRRFCQRL